MRSINDDVFASSTTNGSDFIGSIAAVRSFRVRTSIAGSAAGSVVGRMQRDAAVLESIEFGYPPHRFGFTPVHKDASYTTAQTGVALWTPASGKRFIVTDGLITASGTTDATVSIFDDTDATGARLYRGYLNVSNIGSTVINIPLKTPFLSTAADNVLKLTTSAAIDVDIILGGYEI